MNPRFNLPVARYADLIPDLCDANDVPPLTALVLSANGNTPMGLTARLQRSGQTSPQAQQAVFDFDWYDIFLPTPHEFGKAAKQAAG